MPSHVHLRRPSPHFIAFLTFFVFYFLLLIDVRHWSYRDPSSRFFDPERAFERVYSLEREEEAETWIDDITNAQVDQKYVKAHERPSICVGIATVQREGARYFRRTVGSVLAGLTEAERKDLFLLSFIANVDPSVHSAYNESWLDLVSDQILTYKTASPETLQSVNELQRIDPQFDRKPLFDYIHLLQACYDNGAPYSLILEDDVIGAEGWYFRTKNALKILEQKPGFKDIIYLRLFYNERILGWNSEEWAKYARRCVGVEVLVFILLIIGRWTLPHGPDILTPLTILTITLICTPMSIVLYFLAGRLTVSPLPHGLNRMDTYGCCSQAFIFPRFRLPELIKYYTEVAYGKIDQLTEVYANEHGMARWALTPSVFAHVGSTSSKSSFVSRWGRSNTENIWNFSFEKFEGWKLAKEHFA